MALMHLLYFDEIQCHGLKKATYVPCQWFRKVRKSKKHWRAETDLHFCFARRYRAANSAHNKCTKSSLKLYQIYTKFIAIKSLQFNAVFAMLFTISRRLLPVAVEQCHQRDAAS